MPQIQTRRIGEVEIIDLKGELVGPWALRGRESLAGVLTEVKAPSLLINLKELERVDSLGIKAIVDNMPKGGRAGIICGNVSVMEMFNRLSCVEGLKIYRDEEKVVEEFGKELAKGDHGDFAEKRRFKRVNTALPLEFTFVNDDGENFVFRSIVTNLSEGGLFAEYLDMQSANASLELLDPYDFKMMNLTIRIPGGDTIKAEGKVVHQQKINEQIGIGIEFYKISEEEKKKIRRIVEG